LPENVSESLIAGLGGVFLHSRDPGRLAAWYREMLGIEAADYGDGASYVCEFPLREAEGERRLTRAVWAIFRAKDDEPETRGVTVNYRVGDMAALLERLRTRDVVPSRTEEHSYGLFAWLEDPDGNEVELWEERGFAP
jgi:predicted enzyme related to lactoylglutathione lyase